MSRSSTPVILNQNVVLRLCLYQDFHNVEIKKIYFKQNCRNGNDLQVMYTEIEQVLLLTRCFMCTELSLKHTIAIAVPPICLVRTVVFRMNNTRSGRSKGA
jgi:hypothetical protein